MEEITNTITQLKVDQWEVEMKIHKINNFPVGASTEGLREMLPLLLEWTALDRQVQCLVELEKTISNNRK